MTHFNRRQDRTPFAHCAPSAPANGGLDWGEFTAEAVEAQKAALSLKVTFFDSHNNPDSHKTDAANHQIHSIFVHGAGRYYVGINWIKTLEARKKFIAEQGW
jgi:hypothetical protein